MAPPSPPVPNWLLAALPPQEYRKLDPGLEPVSLSADEVLYEEDRPIRHVYFPCAGVISSISILEDGRLAEVGTIGREGMLGLSVYLGEASTPHRAIVQSGGQALRMSADFFRQRLRRCPALPRLVHRYLNSFLIQVCQSAVCNGLHSVEQRCCRWLLMAHSRAASDQFQLTQEYLARMLGVRLASVSTVATSLRKAGVIRYSRGHLTIVDRRALERCACECYRITQAYFERLRV